MNEAKIISGLTNTCSICGEHYRGYGHNAAPWAGRCCDDCRKLVVLPAVVQAILRKYDDETRDPDT